MYMLSLNPNKNPYLIMENHFFEKWQTVIKIEGNEFMFESLRQKPQESFAST